MERLIHERVLEQAERSPESTAVVAGDRLVSYGELGRLSAVCAQALTDLGARSGEPIGVWMDRSADLVVGILGVLRAGAAYLPIDPDVPPGRAEQLVAASGLRILVTDPGRARGLSFPGVRIVELDDSYLDFVAAAHDQAWHDPMVDPQSLISIYYTSGSTGAPKGVANTHRGWLNRMLWMQRQYRLAPGEAVLQKTILSFGDAAVEVFWPLMFGGRVIMLGPGLHPDPQAILREAIDHRIVLVQFVPSLLKLFLEEIEPHHLPRLSQLRDVISTGEVLRPALLKLFQERLGGPVGCRLNNQWGASESSIDSTQHRCLPEDLDSARVPVGTPVDKTHVYVLDAQMEPVQPGTPGDLYLGGIGLARGYWNEPAKTAAAFVPSPLAPGERIYRTGDVGQRRSDGEIIYLGRVDHQLKVRGIRVEPGEIEHALRDHAEVADVLVTSFQPTPGDHRLAAYLVPRPGGTVPTPEKLAAHLKDRLPAYMIPASFVAIEAFPLTPSGKIDRKRLPSPQARADRPREITRPRNDAEAMIAQVWSEVLEQTDLDINDNFFSLGGHSLLATRVIGRLRILDPDLPLKLLFDHPTIKDMAVALHTWLDRAEQQTEGPVR